MLVHIDPENLGTPLRPPERRRALDCSDLCSHKQAPPSPRGATTPPRSALKSCCLLGSTKLTERSSIF